MIKYIVVIVIALTVCGQTRADCHRRTITTEASLEQVTRQVINSHYASRILSARTEDLDGKKVHVIKMLTQDGRIQQQTFAADTGALLNTDNN